MRRDRFQALLKKLFLVPGFFILMGLGGPLREKTEDGNRHYEQGKYDQALTSYVEARSHAQPESSREKARDAEYRLHFNTGDALYQQKKYEEARKEYEQSLASSDPQILEKAYYNIGNTYFREALQSKSLEQLKQAAAGYRKALEIDPEDEDAKYNLEVVRRHIDLKQKEQPPNQPSCQNQKDQNKKEQQQGDQDQQQQEQQEQAQNEPRPQGGDKDQEERRQQDQQKAKAGEQKKFTREEAERILEAMQEQEKEELKKSLQMRAAGAPGQGKDW